MVALFEDIFHLLHGQAFVENRSYPELFDIKHISFFCILWFGSINGVLHNFIDLLIAFGGSSVMRRICASVTSENISEGVHLVLSLAERDAYLLRAYVLWKLVCTIDDCVE